VTATTTTATTTASATATTTAHGFADVLLPAMLDELGPLCAKVSAVVQLYVTGDSEDLARVVTLDTAPNVATGVDVNADLILALDEAVLTPLLAGTLDIDQALANGAIDADGDLDVLARIASVFSAGSSPLSIRLRAMTAGASS
jgi:hypothetical protein